MDWCILSPTMSVPGTLTLKGSQVTGNSATLGGGGIYSVVGEFSTLNRPRLSTGTTQTTANRQRVSRGARADRSAYGSNAVLATIGRGDAFLQEGPSPPVVAGRPTCSLTSWKEQGTSACGLFLKRRMPASDPPTAPPPAPPNQRDAMRRLYHRKMGYGWEDRLPKAGSNGPVGRTSTRTGHIGTRFSRRCFLRQVGQPWRSAAVKAAWRET